MCLQARCERTDRTSWHCASTRHPPSPFWHKPFFFCCLSQISTVTLMAGGRVPVVPQTLSLAAVFYLPVGGSPSRGLVWLAMAPCAGFLPNFADTAHGIQVFFRHKGTWVLVASYTREVRVRCENCVLFFSEVINKSDDVDMLVCDAESCLDVEAVRLSHSTCRPQWFAQIVTRCCVSL